MYFDTRIGCCLSSFEVVGQENDPLLFCDRNRGTFSSIQFFTKVVNYLGGVALTDVTSGYRVYRVSALESILHRSDRHWAVEQTLEAASNGLRIEEVSVEMPTRESGSSQFSLDTFVLYPARMADVILRVLVFR